MVSGLVFDIRRYAIHDGPGIRTTVFLKGCPLACAWCHNPEGCRTTPELMFHPKRCILCGDCLPVCPRQAISRRGEAIHIDRERCQVSGECAEVCPSEALQVVGREMTSDEVLREVERDLAFYEASGGGVTFSGGEPLAQPRFLLSLLAGCRKSGIATALDTSGFAPWALIKKVAPLVDLFLYDLKLMDEQRHLQWTGVSNGEILANLRRLAQLGSHMLVRIPLIPGVNDDEENLHRTGEFLAELPGCPPVEVLPYHNIAAGKYAGLGREYGLPALATPGRDQMERCAAILGEHGIRCTA